LLAAIDRAEDDSHAAFAKQAVEHESFVDDGASLQGSVRTFSNIAQGLNAAARHHLGFVASLQGRGILDVLRQRRTTERGLRRALRAIALNGMVGESGFKDLEERARVLGRESASRQMCLHLCNAVRRRFLSSMQQGFCLLADLRQGGRTVGKTYEQMCEGFGHRKGLRATGYGLRAQDSLLTSRAQFPERPNSLR
jgi:hypothetical protein